MSEGIADARDGAISTGCNVAASGAHFCTQIPEHANPANIGLWFALLCRSLWPAKAPAALADLTSEGITADSSTYRRWASGHSEPPVSVLWLLLRSREGYRVLSFIMGHDPPAWWVNVQSELRLAKLARDIFKQLEPEMRDG